MELNEEENELINEEISDKSKKTVKNNLIIAIVFIIVFFLFQVGKGKIDFNNLYGEKYLPYNYKPKPFLENLIQSLYNVKEYLIFFSILFILFLFVHNSNLKWEKEMLKKHKFLQNKENMKYLSDEGDYCDIKEKRE